MIIDANNSPADIKLDAQVAIVGSGIAGAVIALRLEELGITTLIIEAGDIKAPASWNIKTSDFQAADYGVAQSYVDLHIQKRFGGGSNVWGGWCSCLREINFARPDIPDYPPWPIQKSDLRGHYEEACKLLQIPNFEEIYLDGYAVEGDPSIQIKKFGFSPPVRIPQQFTHRIAESKFITLAYNLEVKQLRSDNKKTVSTLKAVNQNGEQFHITMKHVVLAGGAVANARLINDNFDDLDLPMSIQHFNGKYLIEHPHVYNRAKVILKRNMDELFKENQQYKSNSIISITPHANWLVTHNRPDFNFQISPVPYEQLTQQDKKLIKNYRRTYGATPDLYTVTVCVEHLPSKANSVLGSQGESGSISLDFGDSVKNTMDTAISWFNERFVHNWIEENHSTEIVAVGHLHGTTRMAETAEHGVVDKNLAVFGTDNMFVAGSSVFPSAGFVNPTLTIAALSCRLSEHIRGLI